MLYSLMVRLPERPQSSAQFPCALLVLIALFYGQPAMAGEADVVSAKIQKGNAGTFSISVGVQHHDEGWDHYADRWDVLAPDGSILGSRILHHPHVDEQPFVRSLSGVTIPKAIREITIRAHDKVHGLGGKALMISVPH